MCFSLFSGIVQQLLVHSQCMNTGEAVSWVVLVQTPGLMSVSGLIGTNKWETAGTFRDHRKPVTDSSLRPDARPNQISRQLPIEKTSPSKYSDLTSFPPQYATCPQNNMGRNYATPTGSGLLSHVTFDMIS